MKITLSFIVTQLWFLYALLHVDAQPFTHQWCDIMQIHKSLKGTLGSEFDNLSEIKDIKTTVPRKVPRLFTE